MDQPVTWLEFVIVIGVFLVAEILWRLWLTASRFNELVDTDEDGDE